MQCSGVLPPACVPGSAFSAEHAVSNMHLDDIVGVRTAALDPLSVRQVGARAGAGGGRGGAVSHLWRAGRVRLLLLHEGEPCLGYNMGMS